MRFNYPVVFPLNQISFVGENDSQYFYQRHGRRFNVLNQLYPLPTDDDEVRVCPSRSFEGGSTVLTLYLSLFLRRLSGLSYTTGCFSSSLAERTMSAP